MSKTLPPPLEIQFGRELPSSEYDLRELINEHGRLIVVTHMGYYRSIYLIEKCPSDGYTMRIIKFADDGYLGVTVNELVDLCMSCPDWSTLQFRGKIYEYPITWLGMTEEFGNTPIIGKIMHGRAVYYQVAGTTGPSWTSPFAHIVVAA